MLKSKAMKKVSSVLATLLIMSMLVPVLAFAASSITATYDKSSGTVTATVYNDVYDSTYGSVYLNVYSPTGAVLATLSKDMYDGVSGATYWYNFSKTVTANTYDYVKLVPSYNNVTGSVYCAVYNGPNTCPVIPVDNGGGTPSPSTGGTTSGGSTGSSGTITAGADGSVDATALANALAANLNVTITVSGGVALLPASALVNARAGATVTVSDGKNTYIIPLSALNLADLAKQLGVSIADLTIRVDIKTLTGDAALDVNTAIASINGASKVADTVDFNVTAVTKDGRTAAVDFGSTYVSRTLALTNAFTSNNVTGVVYNSISSQVSFVPMTLSADGKTATLMRNGNSIYTVLSVPGTTFADIANHWAKADIELLANKLIVQGVSTTAFEPERNISRAEFAALAVRALGLTVNTSATSSFSDVSASAWYNGVVAAAAKAGLVNGYEDGTFRPDAQITREELAALVVRSLKYAGQDTTVSAAEQATLLASYSDANQIVWGQAEVAAAVKAGIVNGVSDTTLATAKHATRAESATMLKRFLTKAGFIN